MDVNVGRGRVEDSAAAAGGRGIGIQGAKEVERESGIEHTYELYAHDAKTLKLGIHSGLVLTIVVPMTHDSRHGYNTISTTRRVPAMTKKVEFKY